MENNIEKTGNWFVDQLSLYQNANNDNATVRRNFVVRVSEFELIMSDLRRKKPKDPLQHELLLGRRGSGKSTLLKRIQIEIEEDLTLSKNYIAINLAEEQAGIYRLSDLWFEALKEIALQTNTVVSLEAFSTFKDNQEYARYLYGEIHKILVNHQKKVVLMLDNLDRIVENFDDDGHVLRETLLNYNDLQIIGGSTRMDEHFWQYDKPFYEFFRRHRLEGLTFEEIHQLLNQWSEALALSQLKDYALHNRGKIEALRILTDGLPRTLQFFIKIFLKNSTLTGFDHIKQTMDLASPLYQERLNNLTAPQRKIVLEMAFIWEACSTKQLVEACRMEGKLISSFMKQLNGFGIVETLQTNTKNHLYRLSERFFNMWLIVTQGNPDQKRKARYLTIFLETWYDADEIQAMAVTHYQNLKGKKMSYDQAVVLTKAISQSKHIGVIERDMLLDLTYLLSDCQPDKGDLPLKFEKIIKQIYDLESVSKYEEALRVVEGIENEEDGKKFALKGFLLKKLENEKDAEKYWLLAIEKGDVISQLSLAFLYDEQGKKIKAEQYYIMAVENEVKGALNNLANLYTEQGREKKAEKYYLLAIEKEDIDAIHRLALLYDEQGKKTEAEKYYLLAIEKEDVIALYNLALLYDEQGKETEAEKYYLLAIEKGEFNAFYNLALLYDNQGKEIEAEKYYLLAIEREHVNSLHNLALLYDDQGKETEAEKYYLLAIEKEDTISLYNLALMYHNQGKEAEAEKYYLLAIEKEDIDALNNLANIYVNQGKEKEAENIYFLAIEKGNVNALNNLANLYTQQGRDKEAKKHYLLAIEKGDIDALNNLANLYAEQGKEKEAEKYYLLAIEKGDFDAFYNLALLCQSQSKHNKAEKYYLSAIDKDNVDALNNLANLYAEQGKEKEAEKYYLLAIKKGNVGALNNLALLYFQLNKNKHKALIYILERNNVSPDLKSQSFQIIIEIWNGKFENIEYRVRKLIEDNKENIIGAFLHYFLFLEQTHLVQSLFEDEALGQDLRDKYQLLYYATLILNHKTENNLLLRIPPDVMPTVEKIVAEVKEKQAFYAEEVVS